MISNSCLFLMERNKKLARQGPKERVSTRPIKLPISEISSTEGLEHPGEGLNVVVCQKIKTSQSQEGGRPTESAISPEHSEGLQKGTCCKYGTYSSCKKRRCLWRVSKIIRRVWSDAPITGVPKGKREVNR